MASTDSLMWELSKQVNTNLVIKLNSGSTEGTNMFTYNGSGAKTVNITASSIGAAASSHNHSASNITSGTLPVSRGGTGATSIGRGLSVSNNQLGHSNAAITASNAGPIANATISSGGSFTVPYITYDGYGHIKTKANRTITLSSELGNFEPVQKRTSYNPSNTLYMYKNGYSCFVHAAAEPASSLKSPLPSAYIPTAEATLCGWCYNISSDGLYPCIALINNRGIVVYISAMTSFGMKNADIYYIYHADRVNGSVFTDRRSNFLLWLTGAWNTSVNGA